jgi:hypothetical protein
MPHLDFEALAVVGRMKLDAFGPEWSLLLRLMMLSLGLLSAADVVASVLEIDDGFGPILDPLELLLLAGMRDDERAFDLGVVEWLLLIVITGLFAVEDVVAVDELDAGDDEENLVGIRFTVLVDTALLSDDIELMRLDLELLRFTNKCLLGTAVFCTSGFSTFFIELTRRGAATGVFVEEPLLGLRYEDGVFLSERLLSSDCWLRVKRVCS